jgi:molecular chaperone DnaJ
MRTACPTCNGSGTIIESRCGTCRGDGRTKEKVRLQVNVPAGIEDNTRIRLAGEGEPGEAGVPSGDLFLIVHVREHDFFIRRGRDLWLEMPVSFTTMALGGDIEVPTLEGRTQLKVPKGTQSGQVLRLRGLGLPDLHGYGRGDQLVRVVVETPTKLTGEQEELLHRFAALDKTAAKPRDRSFFQKFRELFGDE